MPDTTTAPAGAVVRWCIARWAYITDFSSNCAGGSVPSRCFTK